MTVIVFNIVVCGAIVKVVGAFDGVLDRGIFFLVYGFLAKLFLLILGELKALFY